MSESWKELFKLAALFLKDAKIPDDRWTMGGGTVLMLHYNHRISRDIDIFFNDAQLVTFLTPRLNAVVAKHTQEYDEQSNFLKLRFSQGEIDYIIAPRLTTAKPFSMSIDGVSVLTDAPEEIVVKNKYNVLVESIEVMDKKLSSETPAIVESFLKECMSR